MNFNSDLRTVFNYEIQKLNKKNVLINSNKNSVLNMDGNNGTFLDKASSSSSIMIEKNAKDWRRIAAENNPAALDLKCCSWRLLQVDGNGQFIYLVKTNFLQDSYQFLISDLNHFWFESLSHPQFLKRLQELNPNLEAPTPKILDHIKMNLEKPLCENLSISKDESESKLQVWINSDLAGFPFCWQITAQRANEEMVSENTTVPLLMMVSELFRRQKELIQVITDKDKEIQNYKAQGCTLTKKSLATLPFDEIVFKHKMVFSQEFEDNVKLVGTTAFESPGQELYQSIMTKYVWLHRCTKTEQPELSESSSLEEPSTVFEQLEELSAAVEGGEFIQVGKVEIDDHDYGEDDNDDNDPHHSLHRSGSGGGDEQVPIYECSLCIFSTASQDLLTQHLSLYHSEPFLDANPQQHTPPLPSSLSSSGLMPSLQLQTVSTHQNSLLPQSQLNQENHNSSAETGSISCPQCGQRYQTQYGLQSHMNSKHTGKFLFNCSLCGRGFDSYWTYKTHIDRHSIQAEKCDRCNLAFRFKKSLVMHRRFCGKTKITGTDLYRCKICEQTCSSKDSLSTHMRGQHGSQHYRCRYCNKNYKWRSSLKYHMVKCFRKPPSFLDDPQSMMLLQV